MHSLYSKSAMEIFHDKVVSLSGCFVKETLSLHRTRLCDSLIFESIFSFVMSRASLVIFAISSISTAPTQRIPPFCTTLPLAFLHKMGLLWANAIDVLNRHKLLQLSLFIVRHLSFFAFVQAWYQAKPSQPEILYYVMFWMLTHNLVLLLPYVHYSLPSLLPPSI
jgi:hypothetical protein